MQDKIDCNKINEIREERMQTQFYIGSTKSVPTSSTQATHLRFSFLFVNSFTTSEPHRDNPSLVFRNSYNLRDPRSLNQSLCIRRKKKRNSLLKRRILQLKSMDELLMIVSVCPRVSFERAFDNEVLLESLSFILCPKSPIYRPLMTIQKSLEQM